MLMRINFILDLFLGNNFAYNDFTDKTSECNNYTCKNDIYI